MVQAGHREIVRVQRLVDDDRVGSRAEAAQQRRGQVARPRPHRDPFHTTATPAVAACCRYSVAIRLVTGPTLPVPTGRPSIVVTPAISPIVPVQNTSSAAYISVSETSRTTAGMSLAAARSSTVCRVMPSGQATVRGV